MKRIKFYMILKEKLVTKSHPEDQKKKKKKEKKKSHLKNVIKGSKEW